MKDLLLIAHFTKIPGEPGNGRFDYIAKKINKDHTNVEIVTTNFSHGNKTHRDMDFYQSKQIDYKITVLNEPGYKKNVSLKRFYSHYVMGKSLKRYLNKRKKPDLIYCAVPSLHVAKVAAMYAKKNSVRMIIDIQDLWPEAFKMVFNLPIISNIIFYPMNRQANFIYSTADKIIAVSQTYADRALVHNKKCQHAKVVFLGTELAYFDRLAEDNTIKGKPKEEIWLAYIGTTGRSYDLNTVIQSLKLLKDEGINHIKFIVMGDGPLKSQFESYAAELGVYAKFTGRLDYAEMVGMLTKCDIAVNPIKSGSAGSIINKVGDYAAAGLPVLNTQESKEYRKLVEYHQIGFNCKNGCSLDLSIKLKKLIYDHKLRENMGRNNRRLAEKSFDREVTYSEIYNVIGESLT